MRLTSKYESWLGIHSWLIEDKSRKLTWLPFCSCPSNAISPDQAVTFRLEHTIILFQHAGDPTSFARMAVDSHGEHHEIRIGPQARRALQYQTSRRLIKSRETWSKSTESLEVLATCNCIVWYEHIIHSFSYLSSSIAGQCQAGYFPGFTPYPNSAQQRLPH